MAVEKYRAQIRVLVYITIEFLFNFIYLFKNIYIYVFYYLIELNFIIYFLLINHREYEIS